MKKLISVLLLSACSAITVAQHADSLLVKTDTTLQLTDTIPNPQKDSLTVKALEDFFTHEDSLDVFQMIDSLIKLESIKEKSMMAIRLGYNSNIVADNVTLNISQFGLAPGISYYHKSGLYADLTSYYSAEYQPNFYLTVASGGYIKSITKWYSIIAEYSHYFYNQPKDSTVSVPYTNNVGLSNYFEFKPIVLRLDYYYYFGEKSAHRIMPSLGVNLVKKKWLGLDRVSFYPNANVLFGSEQTETTEIYSNILARIIYNRNHPNQPKLPYTYVNKKNKFGVMNYSFTTPISLTKKNWSFLLSYTYNIPVPLPGEDVSLQNTGYIAFSVTKYFGF